MKRAIFWGVLVMLWVAGCQSDSTVDSRDYQYSPVGPTQTLDVPAQYPTIQAAIDAAGKGDFVRVAPGTYIENLNIAKKSFGLRGAGVQLSIISGTVTIIDSSETSLEGFTIKNGGVHVTNSPIRISGNEFLASAAAGLWLEHCQNVVVSDNRFEGNAQEGILMDDSTGVIGGAKVLNNGTDGVAINNSSPTLLNNVIRQNKRDGITIRGFVTSAAPHLLSNAIHDNGGPSNYDVICFGGNTNPTGSGNAFGDCLNCAECRSLNSSVTYQD